MVDKNISAYGIIAQFKIITPMFLGAANQGAELRVPSIKAALRFWYRAIDPLFCEQPSPGKPCWESLIFGGSDKDSGQSKVLLTITQQQCLELNWNKIKNNSFDEGNGRNKKNGLNYLGYPFGLRGNDKRTALAPESTFTLRCLFRQKSSEDERVFQAVAASLWMLGHVGSLGSRSRRGFGSLALINWQTFGETPFELEEVVKSLPLLASVKNQIDWLNDFKKITQVLSTWFGNYSTIETFMPQPHIGPDYKISILNQGFNESSWQKGLNDLGRKLQDFRQRRRPDYDIVKNHLKKMAEDGGSFMNAVPGRVTFGLPLSFRFGSLATKPNNMILLPFEGTERKERQASLLFARLVFISKNLYPMFLRLSGAVPGINNFVGINKAQRGGLKADNHSLDDFMKSLE